MPRLVAGLVVAGLLAGGCGSDAKESSPTTTEASTSTTLPATTELPGTTLTGDGAFMGPLSTVPVGELDIAFRQFGTGPDLLLIAGQASAMNTWPIPTLADLAADHRVTIYDNRDLGSTSDVTAPFTLEDLADDADGLITALGLDHPAVFGWSTGGEVALLLAVDHPDALSSLLITGATPGGPESIQPPPEIVELFADPNPDTAALLDVLFPPEDQEGLDTFLTSYGSFPSEPNAADATAQYDAAEKAYWAAPEPDLSSIAVPALVMNGSEDYAVPPANATYIADRIGDGARLEIDDGGRHAWFVTHPDHFHDLVADFFATDPA
jgi:pimeloyl-ACP methyl ester carboxylesterase